MLWPTLTFHFCIKHLRRSTTKNVSVRLGYKQYTIAYMVTVRHYKEQWKYFISSYFYGDADVTRCARDVTICPNLDGASRLRAINITKTAVRLFRQYQNHESTRKLRLFTIDNKYLFPNWSATECDPGYNWQMPLTAVLSTCLLRRAVETVKSINNSSHVLLLEADRFSHYFIWLGKKLNQFIHASERTLWNLTGEGSWATMGAPSLSLRGK